MIFPGVVFTVLTGVTVSAVPVLKNYTLPGLIFQVLNKVSVMVWTIQKLTFTYKGLAGVVEVVVQVASVQNNSELAGFNVQN